MSWLCLSGATCTPQESAAILAGIVAVIGIFANAGMAVASLRVTRRESTNDRALTTELARQRREHETALGALQQRRAKELEAFRKRLDLAAESRRNQLSRLRDLQTAAEATLASAQHLGNFQGSHAGRRLKPDEFMEQAVDFAGGFLRHAAGVFAPKPAGAPNLPARCEPALSRLRQSIVRVTLLFRIDPGGEDNVAMKQALDKLESAMAAFKSMVAKEEENHNLTGEEDASNHGMGKLPKEGGR